MSMTAHPVHERHRLSVELVRGTLSIDIEQSSFPAEDLFGFAERRNPKRAFLFVSRVLGKHIPVKPSIMRQAFESLASRIPEDLPGPVLMIGMAETAVGLGAGVHRAYSKNRDDVVYLTSTRHPVNGELFTTFEEEHSHASAHLLYRPACPDAQALMLNARSLVLIDDEASTGNTAINLVKALESTELNRFERIVCATLTDWSGAAMGNALGDRITPVSLISGRFSFSENRLAPLPVMPSVNTVERGEWAISEQHQWGRLGTTEHADTFGQSVTAKPGESILVVGTGEFVWKPFMMAERLEREGASVFFGSTTRSPIAIGHAIQDALVFSDNYGLGIPNYLYNVREGVYDRVLICTETPAEAVDPDLVNKLNAEVVAQ